MTFLLQTKNFAEVLIDAFTDLENQTFTYSVPDYMKEFVSLGTPVIVPFGESYVGGYIVEFLKDNPLSEDIKIKNISSASYEQILPEDYIELLKKISDYYYTPFLTVLKAAIPSGILTKTHKEVILTVEEEEFNDYIELQNKADYKEFCKFLADNKQLKVSMLKANFGAKHSKFLKKLQEIDYIKMNFIFQTKSKYKKQLSVNYIQETNNLTNRETSVLSYIKRAKGYILFQDVLKDAETSTTLLRNLEKKGCIDISDQIILRKPHDYLIEELSSKKLKLNNFQQKALDSFKDLYNSEQDEKVMLLHGVTGSGKTEVYLQSIETVLLDGKTTIVLVPEISLTPQTVRRFRERFGDCIAVLHSALSEGERFDEWARIKHGIAKIIIGARSAVFAPCPDLGLIIIDEEHESSYKQDKNPRYNAKTVAMLRASINKATIMLGSATPALESYYESISNKNWRLVELPERVENRNLPKVTLVDMREEEYQGNKSLLSRQLKMAIDDRLSRKEQTIILINRRGFSTFVMCRDCGYSVKCGQCSVGMVYHANHEILKCHYCGRYEDLPTTCPKCKGKNIRHFGVGTQKIESLAQKIFPTATIARLDKDTTTGKDTHHQVLDSFSKGEYDILIGTQMIAKGLDFPNVTLVGIISADTALNLPDFRAGERTFQLITQVAGRAGRGDLKGEVIAQAYSLEHTSIQTSSNHDFNSFYDIEIKEREELIYPPFSKLTNIIIANPSDQDGRKIATEIGRFLKQNKTDKIVSILGPIPAGIPKIQNYYRFQILIKASDLEEVRVLLKKLYKEVKLTSNTKIGIDIEPLNLM
jgi:primosomal protein N' (replication factor Y)